MKNNWRGLVKILEIQHIRDGKIIWEDKNLHNILHVGGEAYMLSCCFDNLSKIFPPDNYYFGLDNRVDLSIDDIITDLQDEPVGNGYLRQPLSSGANGISNFSVEAINGSYRATSQIVTFSATGAGWGPVNNMFLATSVDDSGILISSNKLTSPIILVNGDAVNMRMGLSLRDESI